MKVEYLITNGEKKFFFPNYCKKHRFQNTWITDQDTIDTKQFYRAETVHATSNFNFHTETFFDIRNSFKVKSSLMKVNFLLKTNTLGASTTEEVTNIIHKLKFNQN